MKITSERAETTYTLVLNTEEMQMLAGMMGKCKGRHAVVKAGPNHQLAWRVYAELIAALKKNHEDEVVKMSLMANEAMSG